jgi:hypothetical protein
MKTWNNIQTTKVEIYGIMLVITGILLASVFYPEDMKASILGGIDDLYFTEENATNTLGLNQIANENNADVQK